MNKKRLIIIFLSVFSVLLCKGENNTGSTASLTDITISNFPILDGSDSTSPLRYILMCKLLGFDYVTSAYITNLLRQCAGEESLFDNTSHNACRKLGAKCY